MIRTLPASAYLDPEIYERERRAVFGSTWQLAGFRAQLQKPGDYVLHEFAGWSIVVTVDDAGELRAFHNVCRHRAGPLVTEPCGHGPSFVCRYHGWAYALDGTLKSARDFGDDELDLDAFGLFAVRVEECRGLVFVHLDDHAVPLVDDHRAFFAALAEQPLESFVYTEHATHEVATNWKVYCDNYGEGYHVPLVHPELNKEVVAKEYRVEVADHYCVHSVPAREGAVNQGLWLWRYPNLAINVYPHAMNIERFVPAGPRQTLVHYDYFFADPDDPSNADVLRMGIELLDEDRVICEQVQANLERGVYDTGALSPRHENGLAAFQQWYREAF
jgi:choline monooxygenase